MAHSLQGPNTTTSQAYTTGTEILDRLQHLDQHTPSLGNYFQLLQDTQHELRDDVQHLQRGIASLVQHCDLMPQQNEGFALHPIVIEDDDNIA